MVQGKRSTLLPEDIENAMAALNVEVGPFEHMPSMLLADV
jgi:transcription initiation factor TFIID subunit 6